MSSCPDCGAEYDKGREPDPCLGTLPAPVVSACCGHGNREHASVIFGNPPNRVAFRGAEALAYFTALRET